MTYDERRAEKPIAWRCENCRQLFPATIASTVILVDEISSRWSFSGTVRQHGRFLRRMVVDPACRRKIADQPGQEVDNGQSPASRPDGSSESERAETMETR